MTSQCTFCFVFILKNYVNAYSFIYFSGIFFHLIHIDIVANVYLVGANSSIV